MVCPPKTSLPLRGMSSVQPVVCCALHVVRCMLSVACCTPPRCLFAVSSVAAVAVQDFFYPPQSALNVSAVYDPTALGLFNFVIDRPPASYVSLPSR